MEKVIDVNRELKKMGERLKENARLNQPIEEQTNEIYDLIGYTDSPKLKLIKGGLDSWSEYCFQKEDYP